MNRILNDDTPLRRYLLGELAPDEELKVEARLIADDDYLQQMELVEDDLIDSYASGELNARERENFERHFFITPERQSKLRLSKALIRQANERDGRAAAATDPSPSFLDRLRQLLPSSLPAPALGAALATLVIAFGIGIYWMVYQSEIRKGLRALNEAFSQERPLEARITSLNHAPFSVKRGEAPSELTGKSKLALDRAARIFLDLVSEKPSPQSYHATGRYYLTQRDYPQAIEQFESALKADKENSKLDAEQKAQLRSDYAVALMEKAKAMKDKDQVKYRLGMAESREHLDEALKLDPDSPEALFNQALWLQQQRFWRQAEEAWTRYLEKDSSSPWADEAIKNRALAVDEGKKQVSLTPQELLRDFLAAYQANDKQRAWRVLSHNREPLGKMVWWQLTEAFLNASNNGQPDQANSFLQALNYAGRLEMEKGDRFTVELAAFYRSLPPQQLQLLVQAHALTNQGNALYLNSKYADAFENYSKARDLFRQAGNHLEALLTEFMLGLCYLQRSDPKQSLSILSQLDRICRDRQYLSLSAQTLNILGAAHLAVTEYSRGNSKTLQALKVAERIDDTYSVQKSLAQQANLSKYFDDFHQSLGYLHQCLELSAESWPGSRQMWRTYDTMAQVLYGLRYYSAAGNFQKETVYLAEAATENRDPILLSVSYAQLASIYAKQNNFDEATRLARKGLKESESAGLSMEAYASLWLGHIYRDAGNFNQALSWYTQSADKFEKLQNQAMVFSTHKGLLLCQLALGDSSAEHELRKVLKLAEEYRAKILEERHRNTFFDAEQSVYDIAIKYEYSQRGNPRAAFELSEVSRARSLLDTISARGVPSGGKNKSAASLSAVTQPLKLEDIQEQLPEQTQILQYAVLEDRLIIWVISKTKFDSVERMIGSSDLQEKTLSYWRSVARASKNKQSESEVARQAKTLYELLIAPVESRGWLDKEKTICVAPDKALNYLPFNALVSPATGKSLINEYRLTFAPSSTIFLICSEWAQQREGQVDERLLSVGNPSFDHQAFDDLPASEREANKVAGYYRNPSTLTRANAREAVIKDLLDRFDVLHLATHYVVDDRSPMLSKLLLAEELEGSGRPEQQDGVLQGEEIYQKRPLSARLVVLSACQSGFEGYYNGEGMIGMSRTFIASGVPMVAASLWPVDSEATSELMVNFHRYRKQEGLSTAEALRRAQLDMSNSPLYRQPYYWASFVVIGGHADY
jgi:CHAT domain-containing protein/soluble cytochrome b562